MSGIDHNTPATLPLRLRPSRLIWIAVAAVVIVGIAISIMLFVADDNGSSSPAAATPATSLNRPAGVRYDGGPEEGTRGPATSTSNSTTRYDGGPEEGTRGPGH
jgi:hypothetical protein